jgi:molybdenum cofactor cytidylyltransferase
MIAPSFAAVILAAGDSSRMGRDKALLPWRGQTFLSAAIESLKPYSQLVLVVAGRNANTLKNEIYARGADLILNPEPDLGQFSSLRIGLQEVLNRGRDAALVTLVDRPPASGTTIQALQLALVKYATQGKWAIVPQVTDAATGEARHGHPIAISREMIEVFLRAPLDSTARDVEHAYQERIQYLPVDDPNIAANVNTPEDYDRLTSEPGAQI